MGQSKEANRRIVLASRPVGAPVQENFRMESVPVPSPGEGEVLLRTVYLSLDPYMRGRMSDAPSYAEPVAVDAVMVGATVCRVESSRHTEYTEGEWVLAYSGWQDYALSDGVGLSRLGKNPENPSYALGIMGMPGFTAYMGLLDIGQPKSGETLVVAAATGPVGGTVGQIGKLKGCRVVGVAGGLKSASMPPMFLVFMSAWTTKLRILPSSFARRALTASMSITKMWVARCLMPSCRCSTHAQGSRFAALCRNTTPRGSLTDRIASLFSWRRY